MKTRPVQRKEGFTLIEIMIVVVIIGLLAAMAIPAFAKIREKSQNAAAFNDLRIFANAFQDYATEHGYWPADVNEGILPPEMADSTIRPNQFTSKTPVGGVYDWEGPTSWTTLFVSIRDSNLTPDRAQRMDKDLDDGDTDTGTLRFYDDVLWYFIEDDNTN